MAVGGAFLIRKHRWECSETNEEYLARQKQILTQTIFVQDSLKCFLEIEGNVIPEESGIVKGQLVIEAKYNVRHTGIVILLQGNWHVNKYKFALIGKKENGPVLIAGGTKESYQLDRYIDVNQLPQPYITEDGNLVYMLEVYCYALQERPIRILVGKKQVRWLGRKVDGDSRKLEAKGLEMKITKNKEVFGFRTGMETTLAAIKWKVDRGMYCMGDEVNIELWNETVGESEIELEGFVELIQKVIYQEPYDFRQKPRVMMKTNQLGSQAVESRMKSLSSKPAWQGSLRIPRNVTPSFDWNHLNFIRYVLMFRVRIKGEAAREQEYCQGELSLIIEKGTERDTMNGWDEPEILAGDEQHSEFLRSERVSPESNEQIALPRCRSMSHGLASNIPRDDQMGWALANFAGSALSISGGPPSYSRLSSRRPSLETCKSEQTLNY